MITKIIFLVLLILIMIICSCTSHKLTEHFIFNQPSSISDIDKKLNNVLSKQNELSNKQNKILDKLDYATEYKKLISKSIGDGLKNIDNISSADEIVNQFNSLDLQELYKNELDDLNKGEIDNLQKYKNIMKTKYLIDNEIISVEIDDRVYEKIEFEPPYGDAVYPTHTNEKYYSDKIKPLIDKELSSNPTYMQIIMETSKFENDTDLQPEIYIYDDDDNINMMIDKQIYLNEKTKKELEQYIKEYNIEFNNVNTIREKIKPDFESGKHIKIGDSLLNHDQYKKRFNV